MKTLYPPVSTHLHTGRKLSKYKSLKIGENELHEGNTV